MFIESFPVKVNSIWIPERTIRCNEKTLLIIFTLDEFGEFPFYKIFQIFWFFVH